MPATYEPIATTTLGTTATEITFSSITSAYTDLRLVITWQNTSTSETNLFLQFNGNSTALYSETVLYGDGSSAGTFGQTGGTSNFIGKQNASTNTIWRNNQLDIFNYAGSSNKTFLNNHVTDNNGGGFVYRFVQLFRSTTAISSIRLFTTSGSLNTGTTATLYGILKA